MESNDAIAVERTGSEETCNTNIVTAESAGDCNTNIVVSDSEDASLVTEDIDDKTSAVTADNEDTCNTCETACNASTVENLGACTSSTVTAGKGSIRFILRKKILKLVDIFIG